MLTVRTVFERLWHETDEVCKSTQRTDVPFFIYLDRSSYKELKNEALTLECQRQFGDIMQAENNGPITFAGHKVFIVDNASFHFNLKAML